MQSAPTNKVVSARKTWLGERAQVRTVLLVLVSFLLGVAATASWFHFAANRHAENFSSPSSGEPSVEPSAEPVVNANPPARPFVPSHPPVDAATIEAVKQAVPNYASMSLEDGTQLLRAAALKQFAAAAQEMDAQVKQAQEQLVQAENGQSAAGQPAAMKHLQQVQAEQTEKLQEIAAQLQAQIAALEQLKRVTP
ncbi:MAG TPA: hypothetical protein VKU37_02600 [Verrucomicrobiae bacterium]|nr:hypothetical protein [Verrucomicrobiae bacterium]